mgnify:FL=1
MILSAKTRKAILSVPFAREAANLVVNISNNRFYKKLNAEKHFDEKIRSLKNSKAGQRCFIVGSGPSLTVDQLEAIKDEDCFGANRIYILFEKTTWRPKYYVIQDKYDSTKGVYENLDVEYLFISDFYWKEHGMKNPHAICYHIDRTLKQTSNLPFSDDCSMYIQAASTVSFTMIQLACYMGYKEIYLIGMDHTYANVTNDKGVIIQKNKVKSHAFEDEKPNEVVANISYMEDAYRTARKYCESNGVGIYNATLGGALEIFERKDFWKLMR